MELSWFLPGSSTHTRATHRARGPAPGSIVVALVAILLLGASRTAFASPPDEDGGAFFEQYIRPLLVNRCYECHSKQARKLRGGLDLEHKDGWRKGGDRGPAIEPGNPDASLLIQAVRYEDEELRMPPRGKLPDREIALLTRWMAMGASDPRQGEMRRPRVSALGRTTFH